MKYYMLTTYDNAFDPFNEFEQWYNFDCRKGYNTCEKVYTNGNFREDLTSIEEAKEQNKAIDEVLKNDFQNLYRRVTEEDYKTKSNCI